MHNNPRAKTTRPFCLVWLSFFSIVRHTQLNVVMHLLCIPQQPGKMSNCINYRCTSTLKGARLIELMCSYRNETISVCKRVAGRWKQRGDRNTDLGLRFHIPAVFNQAPERHLRDGFVFCRVPINTVGRLPSQKKIACMGKYANTRHQTSTDKTYTYRMDN